MKFLIFIITLFFLITPGIRVSAGTGAPIVEKIWPDGKIPDDWIQKQPETAEVKNGVRRISNVNTPTLTYYPPAPESQHTDKAVIICPGGGYSILAINIEGYDIAEFLANHGYHAFVLKYRLPRRGVDKQRWLPALQDAQRAVSIVNARKKKLGIKEVGIMGFSAGGHLSALTACRFEKRTYTPIDDSDKLSCRPDFTALIYPAYLVNLTTHKLSQELTIPEKMPRIFIVQTEDDFIHVENSLFFYHELKKKKIPAEMHIYPKGGHGYAMGSKQAVKNWPELLIDWLSR